MEGGSVLVQVVFIARRHVPGRTISHSPRQLNFCPDSITRGTVGTIAVRFTAAHSDLASPTIPMQS